MIDDVNVVFQNVAALHALSMADPSESDFFLANADAAALAELDAYNELLGKMSALSAKNPPPRARDRLMAIVNAAALPATLPKGAVALVRAADGQWMKTPYAGITVKQLFYDPASGNQSVLVRMEPGSVYPSHHHKGLEHSFILEGDAIFSDHTLNRGDYEVGEAGHDHSSITTRGGCLVFIMRNRADIVYAS